MTEDKKLGFKEITPENWLEPDKLSSVFVTTTDGRTIEPITGQGWVQRIFKPKLEATVPFEIQRLFEVARGTMVYGYLFFPIYTLSIEQLFRVIDTSVTLKCKLLSAPQKTVKGKLEAKVNWLIDGKFIPETEGEELHRFRKLRNSSSHPNNQSIIYPTMALNLLSSIVTIINSLFKTS